jgi:nucleoside-diphosphate-sugar epimerase
VADVVVTGASGFIGSHLVGRLAADGHRVTGIDRRPSRTPGTTSILTDLADPDDAAATALRTADAVFHLAGCPGVRSVQRDIERRRVRDNVVATARVLDLTPPQVPVVVTSSSSVYGGARRRGGRLRGCREGDALRPKGGYARSKVAVERLCGLRADRGGLVAVARPFTVAGEGQRPDMAIARWIAAAAAGRPLAVYGSPDRVRDVTDVRQVVTGLIRLAWLGTVTTVNLGTGRGRRLGEILAAVGAALDHDPLVAVDPAGDEEVPATLADARRCRRLLGFVPATDLTDLVRRQVGASPTDPAPDAPGLLQAV